MIIHANDPTWRYAFSLATRRVAKIHVTYAEILVYFEGDPRPVSWANIRDVAFKEALLDAWDMYPVVCVNHTRFVPCRRSGAHSYSIEQDDVEKVRAYHAS